MMSVAQAPTPVVIPPRGPHVTTIASPAVTIVPERARRGQAKISFSWMVWPAVAFVVLMMVFPIVCAAWISLQDASLGTEPRFVGIENYLNLASDPEFLNAFRVTWVLYGVALAMQPVLGTWLGIVLNGVKVARNLVLLDPSVASSTGCSARSGYRRSCGWRARTGCCSAWR